MYLTGRELVLVADIFRVLADSLSEHELRREVGRLLLDLLQADYLGPSMWDGVRDQFGHYVALNMPDDNPADDEQDYRHHDALTLQRQRRRTAVQVADVMAHGDLMPSERRNDFLRRDGPHWGLNLFAWTDGEHIGDLRVWRGQHRDNFSDHELALLELVRPAFTVALARTRVAARADAVTAKPASAGPDDAFSRLTRREREVVELVVEGLLDKEIAQRLGISYTTVRTHLDRSFQKLGVSNRSRLARIVRPLADGR